MDTPSSTTGYASRVKQWVIEKGIAAVAIVVGGPCIFLGLWAVSIFSNQLIFWFEKGEWASVPATAIFYHESLQYPSGIQKLLPNNSNLEFSQWLQDPSSALGPHGLISSFLDWISMPIVLLMTAGIYLWFCLFIMQMVENFKKSD